MSAARRAASEPAGLGFSGWPAGALEFYEGLEADNSKAYWTANKAVYEAAVRQPMDALSAAVGDEFGELAVFRPYRDVRFAKDKTPYKTAIGAMTEGEGGEIYYVELSSAGLMAAPGFYQMAVDQLERHRTAIDEEDSGTELVAVVDALESAGYTIGAHDELRTAPRGYKRDHPRIRLLRMKGLIASRRFLPGPWLATAEPLDRVVQTWRACAELNRWLGQHVGSSTLPPPEFGR